MYNVRKAMEKRGFKSLAETKKHTSQHKALLKVVNQEKVPRTKGMVYKKKEHQN